jgi:hypothetical protein
METNNQICMNTCIPWLIFVAPAIALASCRPQSDIALVPAASHWCFPAEKEDKRREVGEVEEYRCDNHTIKNH